MKLFLDTADLDDVRWAATSGLIDGVSTDPSRLAVGAGDQDHRQHLAALCALVRGPVTAPVLSVTADDIYREGKELARISDAIVVEVPMIEEGLVATARLAADGVRVNVTLVFSAAQALLAARTGAHFVSPFIGRLDEVGANGLGVASDIRQIFDNYSLECEILASSIRTPRHVVEVAKLGVDAAAVPPNVLRALILHPLTDVGLDHFLNDWSKRIARERAAT